MTKHAILSASGSSRWLACPPSVRLEQNFAEESSEFAKEGTLAHELAETMLRKELGALTNRKYTSLLKKIKLSKYFSEDMIENVEYYVNICLEKISESKAISGDPIIGIEQRLDFSNWVKNGFGTGDLVIIEDDLIEVVDLKFGKGVLVSAKNNSQMKLYALGALSSYGFLYGIKKVRMTIVQPRLDNVSVEEILVDDLIEWADNIVKPMAELAFKGEGEFCAGSHCKFCRAKSTCKARAEQNIQIAKYEFKNPNLLDESEIASILKIADNITKWVKDVQEYALNESLNGVKFRGFKLVEGRSTRKFVNPETVVSLLSQNGLSEDDIFKPKELRSLTDLEKKLGKTKFKNIVGEQIFKPNGKPTLVPESDKRQEYNSAALDFN